MNIRALIVVILFTLATPTVLAQTPATDAAARLDDLKDRLATKVAELRSTVKKAAFGTVSMVTLTGATLETTTKNLKIEFSDEAKVFQFINGKRTPLKTENIEKNDRATVFGTYDETLDLLKATVVFIESNQSTQHVWGTVSAIDGKNFVVSVTTPEKQIITVDIEKTTKTNQWTKADNTITKSGFSKIAIGNTVHIFGKTDPKKENHVSAIRFLDLGVL